MRVPRLIVTLLGAGAAYAQSSATLDAILAFMGEDSEFGLFVQLAQAIPVSDIAAFASLLTSNVTIAIPESAPNGTVSQLLGNPSSILPLLSYHIIRAPVDNSSITTSPNHTILPTALTDSSTVFLENNQSQALVLTTESDGTIHILNQPSDVLLTPRDSFGVLDVTYAWANISDLLTVPSSISSTIPTTNNSAFGVEASVAGVLNTYEAQHGITLFVPQDAAFSTANSTLSGMNSTALASVLNGHVLNNTLYSPQFTSAQTQVSLAGQPLTLSGDTVSLQGGNSAKIITSDVLLENGVMHVVDTVLLLDSVKSSGGVASVRAVVGGVGWLGSVVPVVAGAVLAVW
ncbi:FAS1 domain-containing protein [Phlebopus sp. FC_14]|nr:FAS1 domain-containing protein [Phlebopus sp. FC_14]